MTTPVNGNVTDYVGRPDPAKQSAKPGGELGKDAFLKLLVAQLKYQDPSNPTDNSQFLQQTATFTQVERLEEMASAQQSLLSAQLQLGASNLIGRTVTYADAEGTAITGVVVSASFSGSTPTVKVGDTDVPLSSVKEVRSTPPEAPAALPAP